MRVSGKLFLLSTVTVGAIVAAWCFVPENGPVAIRFLRYERVGNDCYAYMEIRNNSSRPITYLSNGSTSTHYVWDSPQIDYEHRLGSGDRTLTPRSNSVFRVLLLTTECDWRVGIDYQIGPPPWSARLPSAILERAHRAGFVKTGRQRAWSPKIKPPKTNEPPNLGAGVATDAAPVVSLIVRPLHTS